MPGREQPSTESLPISPSELMDMYRIPANKRCRDELLGAFILSLATGLSDGEFDFDYPTHATADYEDIFGESKASQGSVARETAAGLLDRSFDEQGLQVFYSWLSEQFYRTNWLRSTLPETTTRILPGADLTRIDYPDRTLHLPVSPTILDLGAGMSARTNYESAAHGLRAGHQPFFYYAINRSAFSTRFVPEYGIRYLANTMPTLHKSQEQELFGRRLTSVVGDMAEVTQDLVEETGQPVLDVVLMSGVHHNTAATILYTMHNIRSLLNPDGYLLVRAPTELFDEESLMFNDFDDLAKSNGFIEVDSSETIELNPGWGFGRAALVGSGLYRSGR